MKAFILVLLLTTSLQIRLMAQQNANLCQNIFVWDVFQDNGKKSSDPLIVGDIETAITRNKGTSVLDRRGSQNIPLKIKNDKANQKTDRISDALAKSLSDEGVKNILFTTIEDEKTAAAVLTIKIYSLATRSVAFNKNLSIPKAIFTNNREKRKDLISDFIKKEVLGVTSPLANTLTWAGVGVGAGATAYGILKSLSIKNDWKTYYAGNPFDTEKKYPTQSSSYKTNQYIAIGGGIVLATSAYLLFQNIQKQNRKKRELFGNQNVPKTTFTVEPLFDNTTGIGIAFKF